MAARSTTTTTAGMVAIELGMVHEGGIEEELALKRALEVEWFVDIENESTPEAC